MTGILGKQPKTKAYLLKTKGPTKYFVTQPFWTPKLEQSPRIKQQSLKDQSVLRDLPPTLHLSDSESHVHCQILFSVWGDLSRTGPSVWFSVSLLCNPPWEVCCGATYFSIWCLFCLFGFVLPFAFLFHSVTMNFCITFDLCPLQTVGSQLSLPSIPWFGIFYLSIILNFFSPYYISLLQCHYTVFKWGNKHVGAWTCPTDTAVAL